MAIKIVTPENLSYFKTKQDEANLAKFAAKTHKHNASDITSGTLAIANGGTGATTPAAASEALSKFKYAVELIDENLNDYAIGQLGLYYAGGGNTCANKPSNISNFGLIVFRSAIGWTTQLLYGSDGKIYTRHYNASAWSSWVSSSAADASNITGTLPVSHGGTGATTKGSTLLSNIGITVSTSAAPSRGTAGTIHIQML